MDFTGKAKIDGIMKSTLDKFDTLDNAIEDALNTLDGSQIRPAALAQLLQVRLQYLQFFRDLKKDSMQESGEHEVLTILQKAPPELREEFLGVWERILEYVDQKETEHQS